MQPQRVRSLIQQLTQPKLEQLRLALRARADQVALELDDLRQRLLRIPLGPQALGLLTGTTVSTGGGGGATETVVPYPFPATGLSVSFGTTPCFLGNFGSYNEGGIYGVKLLHATKVVGFVLDCAEAVPEDETCVVTLRDKLVGDLAMSITMEAGATRGIAQGAVTIGMSTELVLKLELSGSVWGGLIRMSFLTDPT